MNFYVLTKSDDIPMQKQPGCKKSAAMKVPMKTATESADISGGQEGG